MTSGLETALGELAHALLDALALVRERELRAALGEAPRDRPRDRALVGDAEDEAALAFEAIHGAAISSWLPWAHLARRGRHRAVGSGIGAAVARKLAEREWLCVLVGRREDRLRRRPRKIGGEYEVCDVADRDAVERIAARVRERHPEIGLLVNNAGVAGRGDFLDLPPERIEELIRINYLGSVWCLQAFLPGARSCGSVAPGERRLGRGNGRASGRTRRRSTRSWPSPARSRASSGLAGSTCTRSTPGSSHTEGFPQDWLLRGRFRRVVVGPERVADSVVRAIERDRAEIFVPRWYRAAAIAQALVPGTFRRVSTRRRTP